MFGKSPAWRTPGRCWGRCGGQRFFSGATAALTPRQRRTARLHSRRTYCSRFSSRIHVRPVALARSRHHESHAGRCFRTKPARRNTEDVCTSRRKWTRPPLCGQRSKAQYSTERRCHPAALSFLNQMLGVRSGALRNFHAFLQGRTPFSRQEGHLQRTQLTLKRRTIFSEFMPFSVSRRRQRSSACSQEQQPNP